MAGDDDFRGDWEELASYREPAEPLTREQELAALRDRLRQALADLESLRMPYQGERDNLGLEGEERQRMDAVFGEGLSVLIPPTVVTWAINYAADESASLRVLELVHGANGWGANFGNLSWRTGPTVGEALEALAQALDSRPD